VNAASDRDGAARSGVGSIGQRGGREDKFVTDNGWRPSRRDLLKLGGLAAFAAGVSACGGEDDKKDSSSGAASGEDQRAFQMATWGGLSATAFLSTYGGAFTSATGIAVDNSPIMDYSKWQTQIESGKPGWEWGDFEGYFPIGNADLFQDIPAGAVGVSADDMVQLGSPEETARLFTDKTVASYLSAYVIFHDTERNPDAPKNFAEFFDLDAYPGIRSLYNYPYGMLEVALVADGVAWADMYPLDYDRAFAKLDTLGDKLIFANSGAEAQQQVIAGTADFLIHWNGRVLPLAQQGQPVAIEWGDNILILSSHAVPANTDRADVCHEFIKAALSPEAQAATSNLLATGPTVPAAFDLISEDVKPWVPTNPDNAAKAAGLMDDDWWAENFPKAQEEWTAWLG
jgi:putative spermidine/putrescine transport system substrate-binding protein